MAPITLGRKRYWDKVYACWLGKNIGGTLGAPYEGSRYVNDLSFYDPVPTEPLPNDDLDLQLVWLKMLEDRGADICVADFAEYWNAHLSAYPWDEYGMCARNLARGLRPPVSGWFENYYVDAMGSPIRSELWACVAPADPQRAAALAWMDSTMDHAGGEGMWGEMFWAAVESAAFVISDPLTLIRLGLAMIPPACSIARAVREAVWLHQHGVRWAQAREKVVQVWGHTHMCNAPQNHAFTVLGWLYGADFGDKLCQAVNCGYDTDCTGATLGALLGIIGGTAGLPRRWSDPVGRRIVLHRFTQHLDAPKDLEELTARTVAVAERLVREEATRVIFGGRSQVPGDLLGRLFRNEEAYAAAHQEVRAAVARDRDLQMALSYHGEPVLYPGVTRRLSVTCCRGGESVAARVALRAPKGWQVIETGKGEFEVTASAFAKAQVLIVTVHVGAERYAAQFTVLSPAQATGFPSAVNVERCPTCDGRFGACLCLTPRQRARRASH